MYVHRILVCELNFILFVSSHSGPPCREEEDRADPGRILYLLCSYLDNIARPVLRAELVND